MIIMAESGDQVEGVERRKRHGETMRVQGAGSKRVYSMCEERKFEAKGPPCINDSDDKTGYGVGSQWV